MDKALGGDDNLCWVALNGVYGSHIFSRSNIVGVIEVYPRHLILFDTCEPFLAAFVTIDTDKFTFTLVFLVGGFHCGYAFYAIATPSAPEIKHHPFASKRA